MSASRKQAAAEQAPNAAEQAGPAEPGSTGAEKAERDTDSPTLPTAEVAERLREVGEGESVSLGQIAEELEGRAHGLILLALALPELIPMIGLSAVLATPILVIGAYMVWHGEGTKIPGWIQRRSIPRSKLENAVDRALPWLRRLDRISRPRWPGLAHAPRPQGGACILMAVVLAVPIPGVNILAAFGVAGVGIGMLQRDGVVVAVAFACSALALAGAVAVFTGAAALFL